MIASLTTGVSGLRAHQQMLEVVGNNLANVNTPSFKSSRIDFSEALVATLQPAMAPSATQGGVNAVQRGFGVEVSSINVDTSQGTFEATGRTLDLAIQGEGYFVVDEGSQDVYTRVGKFTVDSDGKLVHSANGYRVLDDHGQPISIPPNARLAGRPTRSIDITGNLDVSGLAPSTAVMTSRPPFLSGGLAATETTELRLSVADIHTTAAAFQESGVAATATTLLNDLDGITTAYVDGDVINITGTDAAGTAVSTTFTIAAAATATLGGLRDAISEAFGGATCTIDASGNLVVTADTAGASSLAVTLSDHAGNTGAMGWAGHAFAETTAGVAGLDCVLAAYVAGDEVAIQGIDMDGTQVQGTFIFGSGVGQDGTTLGALRDKICALYGGATCTIDSTGALVLTADQEGPSNMAINLADVGTTMHVDWDNVARLTQTTIGRQGATWNSTISIFDSQGQTHILTLQFEKKGSSNWDLTASIQDGEGTMADAHVNGIRFNEDGSFSQVTGIGDLGPGIRIQFPGLALQEIDINLGTPGTFTGLTQYGGRFSAAPTRQDGYESGVLSTLSVREDGIIQGTFSNGQVNDLAALQVVSFANPRGLSMLGNGFLGRTPNSGLPAPSAAGTGGSLSIMSGMLESSNVDVAYEFTRLIVAQRGFQVNARTIGVTDAVLEELANLIR